LDSQSITDWLVSSAGAAWIIGILGFAFGIFQWLRGRERPSRVIVEQVLETTLLSAPKDPHDVVRVRILYAEEPIDMLWMTELRLRNVSKTVISEPKIFIQVDDETKVLDIQVQEVPPGSEAERVSLSVKDNTFMVAYPYLNPFHEHKQETTIKVLCDRKPETVTVEGGGKGWSIAFLSSSRKGHIEKTVKRIYIWGSILLIASFLGALVVYSYFGHNDLARQWGLSSLVLFTLFTFLVQPILKWLFLHSFH